MYFATNPPKRCKVFRVRAGSEGREATKFENITGLAALGGSVAPPSSTI
jgi:hypothetical protein